MTQANSLDELERLAKEATGLEPVSRHSLSGLWRFSSWICRGIEKDGGRRTGTKRRRLAGMLAILTTQTQAQQIYAPAFFKPLVERSIWQINLRTGSHAVYAGETSEPCVNGQITVRVPSTAEWLYNMDSLAKPTAFVGACRPELGYSGYVILWNPIQFAVYGADPAVMTHEIMHAFEVRHEPGGLMDGDFVKSEFISQSEALQAINAGRWPMSTSDLCTSVLGLRNDLYVPSIMGWAATLKYHGAGTNHAFTVGSSRPSLIPCEGNRIEGIKAELDSVKWPGHSGRAVLEFSDMWRVTSFEAGK